MNQCSFSLLSLKIMTKKKKKPPQFSRCSQEMHTTFGTFFDFVELGQKHILCNHRLKENNSKKLGGKTQADKAVS